MTSSFLELASNFSRVRRCIRVIICTHFDGRLDAIIPADVQALKNIEGFLSRISIQPVLLSMRSEILLISVEDLLNTIGIIREILISSVDEVKPCVEQLLKRSPWPMFTVASAASSDAVQGTMGYFPMRWSISQALLGELKPIYESNSKTLPSCWIPNWISGCKCGIISNFFCFHKETNFSTKLWGTICWFDVASIKCAFVPWNANDDVPLIWYLVEGNSITLHPGGQRIASCESWEGQTMPSALVKI